MAVDAAVETTTAPRSAPGGYCYSAGGYRGMFFFCAFRADQNAITLNASLDATGRLFIGRSLF